jgi:hypothetical protein
MSTTATEPITLHLPLTCHWYDETVKEKDPKRIEYREKTDRWMKLIYDRRDRIERVRFSRAYTKTTAEFTVTHIDLGPCPIPGWNKLEYIRIHFEPGIGDGLKVSERWGAYWKHADGMMRLHPPAEAQP